MKREIQLIKMIFRGSVSSCDLHGHHAFVISIFFDDQETRTQAEEEEEKKKENEMIYK